MHTMDKETAITEARQRFNEEYWATDSRPDGDKPKHVGRRRHNGVARSEEAVKPPASPWQRDRGQISEVGVGHVPPVAHPMAPPAYEPAVTGIKPDAGRQQCVLHGEQGKLSRTRAWRYRQFHHVLLSNPAAVVGCRLRRCRPRVKEPPALTDSDHIERWRRCWDPRELLCSGALRFCR